MSVASTQELLDRLVAALPRLPIFPLRNAFLFPGAQLPLFVFEPRYRAMTAACLAGNGAMAVATLVPGFEEQYHGRPPVRPIAGAGLIVAHRRNEDGTYNILLQGVGRVRIEEELPPVHPYREVRATLLEDGYPPGFQAAIACQAVLTIADRLFDRIDQHAALEEERRAGQGGRGASRELRALCHERASPGELADVLAAALVTNPAVRQQLLESTDVARRLDLIGAELARLLARVDRSDAPN